MKRLSCFYGFLRICRIALYFLFFCFFQSEISKGKATSTFKSLILLYQDYNTYFNVFISKHLGISRIKSQKSSYRTTSTSSVYPVTAKNFTKTMPNLHENEYKSTLKILPLFSSITCNCHVVSLTICCSSCTTSKSILQFYFFYKLRRFFELRKSRVQE